MPCQVVLVKSEEKMSVCDIGYNFFASKVKQFCSAVVLDTIFSSFFAHFIKIQKLLRSVYVCKSQPSLVSWDRSFEPESYN